jgi:hypothetical protein
MSTTKNINTSIGRTWDKELSIHGEGQAFANLTAFAGDIAHTMGYSDKVEPVKLVHELANELGGFEGEYMNNLYAMIVDRVADAGNPLSKSALEGMPL